MTPCVDHLTGLRMKPTALEALMMLRQQQHVTTREFGLTVGFRFGARLLELRGLGFVIDEHRIGGDIAGSTYTLIAEPDTSPAAIPPVPADGEPAPRTDASGQATASTHAGIASAWPGLITPSLPGATPGPAIDGALFDIAPYTQREAA